MPFSIFKSNAAQIDCDPSHGGFGLLDQNEIAAISQRAQALNTVLAAAAAANGRSYLDVQSLLSIGDAHQKE